MSLNCLTTLARVKDWVGVATTGDDQFLTRLIQETSRFVLSYLQRPTLFQYVFGDCYDGAGQRRQVLRHWPVTVVSLVTIDSLVVPPAPDARSSGFTLEPWDALPPGRPQALSLRGYEFCRGFSNVSVVYTAGYTIAGEAQTVPSSAPFTVNVSGPHGNWGADIGAAYANGAALQSVAQNPAQGQYSVAGGTYTFAAADAGASVLLSYSYIPSDVEHACIELAGERYRYKNRIGEISKTLGGQETASFSQKDMPDYVRALLQPYRRVLLV